MSQWDKELETLTNEFLLLISRRFELEVWPNLKCQRLQLMFVPKVWGCMALV